MSSAAGAGEPSSSSLPGKEREDGADDNSHKEEKEVDVPEGDVDLDLYGAAAGWVEARTSCPHLPAMPAASADELARVPAPDSQCSRCHHPSENWFCLICKDVLCSRFINKHMLHHYQESGHCLALSFRVQIHHGSLLIRYLDDNPLTVQQLDPAYALASCPCCYLFLSSILQPSPHERSCRHLHYSVTINLFLEEMHVREDARVDGTGT